MCGMSPRTITKSPQGVELGESRAQLQEARRASHVLIRDNLSDFSHLAFVHVNSLDCGVPEVLRKFA